MCCILKNLLFIVFLIGYLTAQPINQKRKNNVEILKYEFDNHGDGTYNFYYETADGSIREENATLSKTLKGENVIVVRGSYTYEGDDGILYTVRYIADENGFRPEGDHLHTGFKPALSPVNEDGAVVVIGQRIDPKLIGTLLGGGVG